MRNSQKGITKAVRKEFKEPLLMTVEPARVTEYLRRLSKLQKMLDANVGEPFAYFFPHIKMWGAVKVTDTYHISAGHIQDGQMRARGRLLEIPAPNEVHSTLRNGQIEQGSSSGANHRFYLTDMRFMNINGDNSHHRGLAIGQQAVASLLDCLPAVQAKFIADPTVGLKPLAT